MSLTCLRCFSWITWEYYRGEVSPLSDGKERWREWLAPQALCVSSKHTGICGPQEQNKHRESDLTEWSQHRTLFLRCSNNAERITSVASYMVVHEIIAWKQPSKPIFLGPEAAGCEGGLCYLHHLTSGELWWSLTRYRAERALPAMRTEGCLGRDQPQWMQLQGSQKACHGVPLYVLTLSTERGAGGFMSLCHGCCWAQAPAAL